MALTPTTPQNPANREAAQQDMLLREVDEAVRQDEAAQFARRYGKIIAAVVVIALLAFGAWLLWDERSESKLEEGSETFVTALDQLDAGNADTADKDLATLADDGAPAAAAGAAMLRAGIASEKGQTDKAVQMFEAVAKDDGAPQEYRELATIRAVATNYDKLPPQQVIDRLKPLAKPGNPWFPSAAELVAMAYLKQGKKDLAGPLFAAIAKEDDAPPSIRSRARQMAGMLGFDAVEDVDKTLAELRDGEGDGTAAPAAQ